MPTASKTSYRTRWRTDWLSSPPFWLPVLACGCVTCCQWRIASRSSFRVVMLCMSTTQVRDPARWPFASLRGLPTVVVEILSATESGESCLQCFRTSEELLAGRAVPPPSSGNGASKATGLSGPFIVGTHQAHRSLRQEPCGPQQSHEQEAILFCLCCDW